MAIKSKPHSDSFDLDDMIRIGMNTHLLSYQLEDHVRWKKYCECLNHCEDPDWLYSLFEEICIRIARKTGGFRPVFPDDFDGPLHAVVWASLDLCIATSRTRLDAGEILRKGDELGSLLRGPRITAWWWKLIKTGAKSKGGTSLGGRTSSEMRRIKNQRWLAIAEERQRRPNPPKKNSRNEAQCVLFELKKNSNAVPPMETVRSALTRLRKRENG